MAGRSGSCRCTFDTPTAAHTIACHGLLANRVSSRTRFASKPWHTTIGALVLLIGGCQRGAPAPLAVAPLAAAPAAARADGGDWPRVLGPLGTGVSPEPGIRPDWSNGLPVVWQIPVGEGYCAPVIAGGRVFHFDRHGGQARLTAYHPDTAAELWRFEYPTEYRDRYGYDGGPRACPVVDGDRVYV